MLADWSLTVTLCGPNIATLLSPSHSALIFLDILPSPLQPSHTKLPLRSVKPLVVVEGRRNSIKEKTQERQQQREQLSSCGRVVISLRSPAEHELSGQKGSPPVGKEKHYKLLN